MRIFAVFVLTFAASALLPSTPAQAQKSEAECRRTHLTGWASRSEASKENARRGYNACVAGLKKR